MASCGANGGVTAFVQVATTTLVVADARAAKAGNQPPPEPPAKLKPDSSATTATAADESSAAATAGEPSDAAAQLARARKHIAAFASPQDGRAAWEVAFTFILWFGSLAGGHFLFKALTVDTWWGVAAAAAWVALRVGAYARGFSVLHDAVHCSLFTRRWANRAAAIGISLLLTTNASDYARTHAQHHEILGIEEEVGKDPDIMLLWTTDEWAAWPRSISKAAARVLRDPLLFIAIGGPAYVLLFNTAWPHRVHDTTLKARLVYVAGRAAYIVAYAIGLTCVMQSRVAQVAAELLAIWLACCIAMILYLVQHTFEGVYLGPRAAHNHTGAALLGTSHLRVAWWLRWALPGVEGHHVHHANARVPGYRMQECIESAPPGLWEDVGVVSLGVRECAHALLLALWDSDERRYVPFPEWAWLERLLRPVGKGKVE